MQVMKILNKYMKPFLTEHGFRYKGKIGRNELCYIHKDNDEVRIFFSYETIIEPCSIITQVYGGIYDYPGIDLALTDLLNGPNRTADVINTGQWYFDTEEELLGILEYQAELFKEWVFDWMLGRKYTEVDVYMKKKMRSNKQATLFDNASKEEQDKIEAEAFKIFNEWEAKRFYPVNWKL